MIQGSNAARARAWTGIQHYPLRYVFATSPSMNILPQIRINIKTVGWVKIALVAHHFTRETNRSRWKLLQTSTISSVYWRWVCVWIEAVTVCEYICEEVFAERSVHDVMCRWVRTQLCRTCVRIACETIAWQCHMTGKMAVANSDSLCGVNCNPI